jgi:hypothetical protein
MTNFQGFTISQNEDGFYWQEDGYFDTIEECRASIADWNNAHARAEPHEDTPCLDPPWWATP